MTLQEALKPLGPCAVGFMLEQAEVRLAELHQPGCRNYPPQVCWCENLVRVLRAAALCGSDSLPDIPVPQNPNFSELDKYGKSLLEAARRALSVNEMG